MKYKEFKEHYKSGHLFSHYFLDESGSRCGEYRRYYKNGQLWWHSFSSKDRDCGDKKSFRSDGTLQHHYLKDGKGNEISTVNPSIHTEEQLIEIAKEHNLPLLSELPKTEAELTHWNLKWPDCPCLPIESK